MSVDYRPGCKVGYVHSEEVINRAVALPDRLRSDDGRIFHVREWYTKVSAEHGVEVTGVFEVSFDGGACSE